MAEEAKREEAKRIRTTAKARFTRKRNEFFKSVEENKGMETVKRTFGDLHEAWNIVEGKHDIYMIHSPRQSMDKRITRIVRTSSDYSHTVRQRPNLKRAETSRRISQTRINET